MRSILCFVCCVTLGACWAEPSAPSRPPGVPATAIWAGGVDGGDWIDCRVEPDANPCTVYNDHSGDVEVSGRFVLEGTGKPASRRELQYEGGTDGERIYLKDGRRLVRR